MIWENWPAFWHMGGYAGYVWGSLIVTSGCMLIEISALKLRSKKSRAMAIRRSEQPGRK